MKETWQGHLEKIDDYRWRIPKSYNPGMRVPGIIYADENLLKNIRTDRAPEQVANVAHLPGIVKYSLAMPDIHWGYGAPIGGVAAFDIEKGIIAPGMIGYDINCGVRLMRTNLSEKDVKAKMRDLVYALFNNIPAGVGSKGKIRASGQEERKLLTKGAMWAVERGYGRPEDLEYTEERGAMQGADLSAVSSRAYERGEKQSGTLGSGNHFVEVQVIDQIYDEQAAAVFNLHLGEVTVMIHSGSRGFGYQICDDYAKGMIRSLDKYGIRVPDRQLACAPVNSPEGKKYLGAMRCAANYAWCNRQVLMELTRRTFEKFFNLGPKDLGMDLIYDVAHNIAKIEKHTVEGKEKLLCVHRKGATRAFPPGHAELPEKYKSVGQPVIIPGDMGRNSYLLVGTKEAAETFYSTCFTGDTKILTDRGIVTLKEIYEFNKLGLTYHTPSINKDSLTVEWKPILEVSKRATPVMRISVSQTNKSRFSTLDTSLDHKFSVFDSTELKFEAINKVIDNRKMTCVLDKLEIPWRLHYPDLAFLIGAITTDGYIENRKNKRIVFTQKKTEKKLHFIDCVQSSFKLVYQHDLKETKTKTGGGLIRGKEMLGTATDFISGGKYIVKEIAAIRDSLQTWILQLNQVSTLNFLAGVIDGDGTWNPAHSVIEIFNSDEKLVGAILLACLKLGILPYISIQRESCYVIQISEKLEEILNFTKRVKGLPRKHKYGNKLFPVRQLFTENWILGNIKWPFKGKADRNSLMEGEKILEFLRWNSSYRYNRKRILDVISSPLRMHRVRKIEELGVREVFNLNVQDNHNYFVFTRTFMPVLVKNCHGSGRVMSRSAAIRNLKGRSIARELEQKGIFVRSTGRETLAEEAPEAYKNVSDVVSVVHQAGISKRTCRMRPLGAVKG